MAVLAHASVSILEKTWLILENLERLAHGHFNKLIFEWLIVRDASTKTPKDFGVEKKIFEYFSVLIAF